ncbi:DUF58 domain-containing protein [Marinomonas algarum]|uniref:DUF58 domain-containing protein n=1 Tax=Marinomonas algarum TaxID=2883105 RepID=A0A9X1LF30_9GAMM|nr:DUF58 domain-containing protein [Marinomonas algarum]MCB5162403.1 DUF58 domain-containing protein [Marinomonas algarum]
MSPLLAPLSPELDDAHFSLLAHYAKHLGRAPKAKRFATNVGERRSRQKGHGMEMLELRAYQASDDLRHIDWRVTARTGQAHTRLYAQENDHQRLLLLDLSPNAYFGTQHTFISTRLLQLAGLIAWRSIQQGDALAYRIRYGEQEHQSQKTELPRLLNSLREASCLQHRTTTPPHQNSSIWVDNAFISRTHNKDVIILTDKQYWDSHEESALLKLAKHNRVHWVQVIDNKAFQLPAGHYQMTDGTNVRRLSVSDASLKNAKEDFLTRNTQFKQALLSMDIQHHPFDLSEPPERIARYLLSQGALR